MRGTERRYVFALPTVPRELRIGLAVLLGAYFLELALRNGGFDVYRLSWSPLLSGFEPWQLASRYLVQGGDEGSLFRVLASLAAVVFLWPHAVAPHAARTRIAALAAAAVGGTTLAFALDVAGLAKMPNQGWDSLAMGLPVLAALGLPGGRLEIPSIAVVTSNQLIGAIVVLSTLLLAFEPTFSSAEQLGVQLALVAWWHGLGPGAARRRLLKRGDEVLRPFTVIQGGRAPRPDEWTHRERPASRRDSMVRRTNRPG